MKISNLFNASINFSEGFFKSLTSIVLSILTLFFIYSCTCENPVKPLSNEVFPNEVFLISLEKSSGSFSPGFSSNTYQYTLTLAPGTTSVSLTPTASIGATLSYILNGSVINTNFLDNLTNGSNNRFSIKVISEDGNASNDYDIDVIVLIRRDAFLLSLETNSGSFSPGFSSNTYQYTLTLAPGTTSVSLTSTASSGATLSYMLNGSAINTNFLDNLTNGSSNRFSIKVISEDGNASNDYEVDVRVQTIHELLQKVVANDAAADDRFGISVSVDRDTAVVGAFRKIERNAESGSAYIYTRSGTNWSQQAKLIANDGAAADQFGYSVSVSGDTAVIGANGNDDNGNNSGSAYIFARSGTSWSQQAKLIANDAATNDRFGISVSVFGDTAVIGANGNDDNGDNSGSAYIFARSGASWSQQAKLTAEDAAGGDRFGISVSVSGNTAIIGADGADTAVSGSGSAYIFTRSGTNWSQQAKLTAEDAATSDRFGVSVSMSGDTAVIGANQNEDNGDFSGSAYIFTRSGTNWSQQAKLTAEDAAAGDRFGISVSVSGDTALIGANQNNDNGNNSGSAYIFTRSAANWTEEYKLTANDAAADDRFGISVSVSGDTAVIGANQNNDNGDNSGSAYIFDIPEE